MREKTIPRAIIIVMLVSLSIPIAMAQPPMPPCWFYGTVIVEGSPAQDNLNVTAAIRGTNQTWTTKTKNGTYGWTQRGSSSFYIPSDDPMTPEKDGGVDGDTIEFYINGTKTNQTTIFENLSLKRVDLAVGSTPGEYHTLTVNSDPISGIEFTVDGVTQTTPYSDSLLEGDHTVVMPSVWTVDSDVYNFVEWEDASTDPSRTVSLTTETTITAYYEKEEAPVNGPTSNPHLLYATLAIVIVIGIGLAAVLWIHRKGYRIKVLRKPNARAQPVKYM